MLALESKWRTSKELLRALREEIAVPKRQDLPADATERIATLRAMAPIDFERQVMSLFAAEGYDAGVTCRSNDFGVDGFVTHPDGMLVVQCKRNSLTNTVGRPVVQQFKGVIEEQNVNGGEKVWRLAVGKCSALVLGISRWSVAGSSRRGFVRGSQASVLLLRRCRGCA